MESAPTSFQFVSAEPEQGQFTVPLSQITYMHKRTCPYAQCSLSMLGGNKIWFGLGNIYQMDHLARIANWRDLDLARALHRAKRLFFLATLFRAFFLFFVVFFFSFCSFC